MTPNLKQVNRLRGAIEAAIRGGSFIEARARLDLGEDGALVPGHLSGRSRALGWRP